MLKPDEMSHRQALLGCLVLGLTAPTDAKAKVAGDLAEVISEGMSNSDVELCQKYSLQVQTLSDELFVAVANSDERDCAKRYGGSPLKYSNGDSVFCFKRVAERSRFVKVASGARLIDHDDAKDVLTTAFQLLIERADEQV